jgi:hypothetical protein
MRKPKQRDGSPRRKKPPPPEAFSAHATGGAARCSSSSSDSTVEALANARERLERDAVDILMRQKKELETECDRLRREVDRAAESFKLAWQSERAAHQHDLEGAALRVCILQPRQPMNTRIALRSHPQRAARRDAGECLCDVGEGCECEEDEVGRTRHLL